MVTYERPVEAHLHVHLANGETFEASKADLAKFNLINATEQYAVLRKALVEALCERFGYRDLTDARLNPVRALFEMMVYAPGVLDDGSEDRADLLAQIGDLEAALIAAESATVSEQGG